jgi:glycosyltransferase involved in cell wall biosynthesis
VKVLQINSVCGIGSTGRIVTDLYKVIEEHGHRCCVSYGRGFSPNTVNSIRVGTEFDVYSHVLYNRITDKMGFASIRATKKFIEQVEEYDPDIIHLHNIHGYYINIEILFEYLKRSKKPVIWSLYDCWSFTGHCAHFDYTGCDKWKTGCHHCEQKRIYPASYFFDNSKKNYNRKKFLINTLDNITIVSPTNWLSTVVKESYLKDFPTTTIPSGIDLKVFKPTQSGFRSKYNLENKFVVLGVSNGFSENKGSNYFIELAKNLPKDYKLVMVGVKDKERKQIPNNVLVLPRTSNTTELAQIYTEANVFVNPTLEETQGLTNIEALACGTSVVTFNSGGSPECIDSSCGVVVEKGDLKGLLKAISQTSKVPFDSKSCIDRAKLFDKSKLFEKYIKLYEEVTN